MYRIVGVAVYLLLILLNISVIKKDTGNQISAVPVQYILLVAIMIPSMPILVVLLGIFAIYRSIIDFVLRIRYGDRYYGLLRGADSFHAVGESSNSIIVSCFIVRVKNHTFEELSEIVEKIMAKCFIREKFKTLFCKSFGYPYLLRQELDILSDCFCLMKIINCEDNKMDKESFFKLLNYHHNEPMPKDGKVSCQVLLGSQRIHWKDDDYDYYPLMFKMHHAVADGIVLLKAFVGSLLDTLNVEMETVISSNLPKPRSSRNIKILKYGFKMLETLFLILILYPSSVVVFSIYKAKDVNILHSVNLTQHNVLGMGIEQKKEYVEKIKKIKNKFSGTAFPTVLLTAYAASLSEYFSKNCSNPPSYITSSIPVMPGASNLGQLNPQETKIDELDLRNSYSLMLLRLPITAKQGSHTKVSLIENLKLLNKEIDILKNSLEFQINSFFMQVVCAVLPLTIIRMIIDTIHSTTIVSVMVGPPKMTSCKDSLALTDMMAWVPHLYNIGTSLAILTYDGRLHIGLSADKALISKKSDAQIIVNNIFKYLDILYEEVEHCNEKVV